MFIGWPKSNMEYALDLGGGTDSKVLGALERPAAPNFFNVMACETTKSLLHPALHQGLLVF